MNHNKGLWAIIKHTWKQLDIHRLWIDVSTRLNTTMDIVDLPSYKMVIFQLAMLVYQSGKHPAIIQLLEIHHDYGNPQFKLNHHKLSRGYILMKSHFTVLISHWIHHYSPPWIPFLHHHGCAMNDLFTQVKCRSSASYCSACSALSRQKHWQQSLQLLFSWLQMWFWGGYSG